MGRYATSKQANKPKHYCSNLLSFGGLLDMVAYRGPFGVSGDVICVVHGFQQTANGS
jgi:hypothetical protein